MPGMNGTGPMGQGPMTGRKMGRCGGNNAAGTGAGRGMGAGRGAGAGMGRGAGRGFFGRGFCRVFGAGFGFSGVPASDESLQQREELLKRELDAVQRQRQSMNRSDDEL